MATITLTISAILAILAGLLVLLKPKMIRLALGFYLIAIGVIRLIDLNIA